MDCCGFLPQTAGILHAAKTALLGLCYIFHLHTVSCCSTHLTMQVFTFQPIRVNIHHLTCMFVIKWYFAESSFFKNSTSRHCCGVFALHFPEIICQWNSVLSAVKSYFEDFILMAFSVKIQTFISTKETQLDLWMTSSILDDWIFCLNFDPAKKRFKFFKAQNLIRPI